MQSICIDENKSNHLNQVGIEQYSVTVYRPCLLRAPMKRCIVSAVNALFFSQHFLFTQSALFKLLSLLLYDALRIVIVILLFSLTDILDMVFRPKETVNNWTLQRRGVDF